MKRLCSITLISAGYRSLPAVMVGSAEKDKGPANRALMKDGGARRDRTADLYNAIVALSQLSYGPTLLAEGRAFRHSDRSLST